MKTQSSSAISYVFRNILYLLPFTLLPALLLAFSTSTVNNSTPIDLLMEMGALANGSGYEILNFKDHIYSYLSFINFTNRWWIWLLGLFAAFISLCCTFPAVERHMRLGVKQFTRVLFYINDCFFPLLSYLIIMMATVEVLSLVGSGIILLVYTAGLRAWPLFAVTAIVIFLVYLIFSIILVFTVCTVPARLMERYRLNIALSYSTQLVGKNFFRVYGSFVLIIAVSGGLLTLSKSLLSLFPAEYSETLHMIVSTLFNIFWLTAVPAFSLKTYIFLTDSERKDLKTRLFLR